MATRVIMLAWAVLITLSLSALVVAVLAGAGMAAGTVAGAARRARRRGAGLGALAGQFPETTLARIDEELERVWLEEQRHRLTSP